MGGCDQRGFSEEVTFEAREVRESGHCRKFPRGRTARAKAPGQAFAWCVGGTRGGLFGME